MTTGENINGIDVEQLDKTISQLKRNNNIAKFRFQAESRWVNGSHSRAVATSFYGASVITSYSIHYTKLYEKSLATTSSLGCAI